MNVLMLQLTSSHICIIIITFTKDDVGVINNTDVVSTKINIPLRLLETTAITIQNNSSIVKIDENLRITQIKIKLAVSESYVKRHT